MENKQKVDRLTLRWLVDQSGDSVRRIGWLSLADFIFASVSLLFAMISRGIIDSATARDARGTMSYGLALVIVILVQMAFRILISRLQEDIHWTLSNQFRLLRNLSQLEDKTCILVTHRSAALAICNNQLIIQGTQVHLRILGNQLD